MEWPHTSLSQPSPLPPPPHTPVVVIFRLSPVCLLTTLPPPHLCIQVATNKSCSFSSPQAGHASDIRLSLSLASVTRGLSSCLHTTSHVCEQGSSASVSVFLLLTFFLDYASLSAASVLSFLRQALSLTPGGILWHCDSCHLISGVFHFSLMLHAQFHHTPHLYLLSWCLIIFFHSHSVFLLSSFLFLDLCLT